MADSNALSFLCIGSLGTGFLESSLERGLALDPDFIGADAGSVDGGPNALAGVAPGWPDAAYRRDLDLLMRGAARHSVGQTIASSWAMVQVAAMLSPVSPMVRAGHLRSVRSTSRRRWACGSENSQVPPASQASPAVQTGNCARLRGRATSVMVFKSMELTL